MDKFAQAEPIKLLSTYISFLRSLYLIHQSNHWACKGPAFYAHHLLFQRLYESAQESADKAAEKTIGLFSSDVIDPSSQAQVIQKLLVKYSFMNYPNDNNEQFIMSSLNAEKDFLNLSKKIYNALKESGNLSMGMDNMMQGISDKSEEAVYLLQQSL